MRDPWFGLFCAVVLIGLMAVADDRVDVLQRLEQSASSGASSSAKRVSREENGLNVLNAAVAATGERAYQDRWCRRHKGQAEHVLPDLTRVDCLTETHAIEVDYGNKWAEAIGQALYYSLMTGRRAGVVLIVLDDRDRRGAERLKTVIDGFKLPIEVWRVTDKG